MSERTSSGYVLASKWYCQCSASVSSRSPTAPARTTDHSPSDS